MQVLVQAAGRLEGVWRFIKASLGRTQVDADQDRRIEAGVIGELQRQISHRAGVEETQFEILAEADGPAPVAPEQRRADQVAVAPEQPLLPGLSWRFLQQKQLAARLDRNRPGMFFPERHPLADSHRLGEEFGLLEGKTGVGAGIKKG